MYIMHEYIRPFVLYMFNITALMPLSRKLRRPIEYYGDDDDDDGDGGGGANDDDH